MFVLVFKNQLMPAVYQVEPTQLVWLGVVASRTLSGHRKLKLLCKAKLITVKLHNRPLVDPRVCC